MVQGLRLAFFEPVAPFAGRFITCLHDEGDVAAILGSVREPHAAGEWLPGLVFVKSNSQAARISRMSTSPDWNSKG